MRFLFNYGSRPSRQQLTAHKVNGQYIVATYRQFSGFVTEVDVMMPRTGEVIESAVYTHRTDDLLTANEVHAQTCQSMRDGHGQAWDSVEGWRLKWLKWGRDKRESPLYDQYVKGFESKNGCTYVGTTILTTGGETLGYIPREIEIDDEEEI